eukprot:jgi/Chlat1/2908/Chrsp2S04664
MQLYQGGNELKMWMSSAPDAVYIIMVQRNASAGPPSPLPLPPPGAPPARPAVVDFLEVPPNATQSTVAQILDSNQAEQCAEKVTLVYVDLPEGPHTFVVEVYTALGARTVYNHTWLVDTTPPRAILDINSAPVTNYSDVQLTIRFSEPCYNASVPITCNPTSCVVNATGPSALSTPQFITLVPNQVFHIQAKYAQDGAYTISIPAGVCSDAAGNANVMSVSRVIVYDKTPPEGVMETKTLVTTPYADDQRSVQYIVQQSVVEYMLYFSEPVQPLSNSSLLYTNALPVFFRPLSANTTTTTSTSNTTNLISAVSFALRPTNEGLMSAALPAGTATDAAGNANARDVHGKVFYADMSPPTVTIKCDERSPTTVTDLSFFIHFSEQVLSFDLSDVNITRGGNNTVA